MEPRAGFEHHRRRAVGQNAVRASEKPGRSLGQPRLREVLGPGFPPPWANENGWSNLHYAAALNLPELLAIATRLKDNAEPLSDPLRHSISGSTRFQLELTRCGGHLQIWVIRAGVPAPDGGVDPGGRSPVELAREFECSASAIRNWVRQADRDEV